MENNKNTIQKLQHLIAIAEDGKEGYENAQMNIKDYAIQNVFNLFIKDRTFYASQLREILALYDTNSENTDGSLIGTLHRIWMDFKSTFASGSTEAIISACITGEEAAIIAYKEVLQDDTFPIVHKSIIARQLLGIEQTVAHIKSYLYI